MFQGLFCYVVLLLQCGVFTAVTDQRILETPEERQARNYEELRIRFRNEIFISSLLWENEEHSDLVETREIIDTSAGRFDFNIQIPIVNIENGEAEIINDLIWEEYIVYATNIVENARVHTIFNVDYAAYINDNILSIVIRSTYRSGRERLTIRTFNIDLNTNEFLTLEDIIARRNLDTREMQEKIDEEIEAIARHQEAVQETIDDPRVEVLLRDPSDKMYRIENIDNFFIGERGHLFIVFAYGNESYTRDVDLVIF